MLPSLKQQLLFWLLAPMLVIAPLVTTLEYWLVISPAKLEFDHQLGDMAIAIASFLKVEGGSVYFSMTDETEHLLRTDAYDKEFFLVLDPNGKILAGDVALNTPEHPVTRGELRYVDHIINKFPVRMIIYGVACGEATCQIRMAETRIKRQRMRSEALMTTLLAILVLGVITTGVMLIAVRHGLKPLQALRSKLADRTQDDFSALELPQAPSELQPLIKTLNQLFKRQENANTLQKAFLADAAHQLRTPLAALQTESELSLLEPHPESLHPALERMHQSVSRAVKLANQLLVIAHTDPDGQSQAEFNGINLRDIGAEAANEWSSRAYAAGVDLGFQLESACISGQTILLQELLSNLIHNAIEHAGKGSQVTVKTYVADRLAVLEVEDDGPGINEYERQKVLQRFFRGQNAKGAGSGLGMAIVSDIVRIHSARLKLTKPKYNNGLLVRVEFQIIDPSGAGNSQS